MAAQAIGETVKGLQTSKTVGDLIESDAKIYEDGSVEAAFKKVDDFTDFSKTDNSGFFFAYTLGQEYQGKTIKVQRTAPDTGKAYTSQDLDWVLKVGGKTTAFTVWADDTEVVKLNFEKSTFPES